MNKILILILSICIIGCHNSNAPEPKFVGRYDLISINDTLPYRDGPYFLTSGNVTLHDDGTFIDVMNYEFGISNIVEADTIFGNYSVNGSDVTFTTYLFGEVYQGTWNDKTLLYNYNNYTFKYRRK
jgi:hypothetical protein